MCAPGELLTISLKICSKRKKKRFVLLLTFLLYHQRSSENGFQTTFCYNRASSPRSVWNLMKTPRPPSCFLSSTTTAFAAYGFVWAGTEISCHCAYVYVYSGRQGWGLKQRRMLSFRTRAKTLCVPSSRRQSKPVGQRSTAYPPTTKEKTMAKNQSRHCRRDVATGCGTAAPAAPIPMSKSPP